MMNKPLHIIHQKRNKYKKAAKLRLPALLTAGLLLAVSSVSMPSLPVYAEGDETPERAGINRVESLSIKVSDEEEKRSSSRKMAAVGQEFRVEDTKLHITEEMDTKKEKSKEYTLMVYLLGSNLESRFGNATTDLCEMIDAGIDPEKVNILVYTGGSRRWLTGIPSDRNCVLELNGTDELPVVAETDNNADMGAPETLTEFLNFCNTYYPAEHNALVLWDHGGGPLMGFGSDELFSQDSLLLSEMKQAMKKSPYSKKNKLDWVGFDACLMGSLESMKVWSDYARYYVASEELEPGCGWDYTALSVMNDTQDPVEITGALVDGYQAFYENAYELDYCPDLTLAASDLSKVASVEKALGNLAGKMKKAVGGSGYSRLQKARVDTKAFGLTDYQEDVDEEALDLVDLKDFTERVEQYYPGKSATLLKTLDQLVVKSYANVEHANGVSFYYPYRNKQQYQKWKDVAESVSVASEFKTFVKTLTARWLSGRSRDWSLKWEKDGYSLQLTEEQMKDTAAVYYTLLERGESFDYHPILEKVRIYPDENGLVRVPADPEIICLKTDEESVDAWPAIQVEAQEDVQIYTTQKTALFTDSNVLRYMDLSVCQSEYEPCTITLASDRDTEEDSDHKLQIRNVSAKQDSEGSTSGKNTLDLSHYECIYNSFSVNYPSVDEKGNTRPYKEWPETGSLLITYEELDEQPEFVWRSCSEICEDAVIQLILEDTSGELYATDLVDVQPDTEAGYPVEQWVETENGECRYRFYPDYAVLAEYKGTDAALVIPQVITSEQGVEVPVTAIACDAFDGVRTLKKVMVSEGIRKIDDNAFKLSGIEEIELPSSLETIGKNAFALCFDLKSIDLPSSLTSVGTAFLSSSKSLEQINIDGSENGSCEACTLIDGVLYSADGKVLVAYPGGREGSCRVKDGTEEIGYGAFTRAALSTVELPEGLKRIGVSAFAGCKNLTMPELPDSLESLEAHAFGAYTSDLHLTDEAQKQTEIRIGSKLSYLGQGCLDLFAARTFTVDEENAFFSEVDGNLCNKSADAVKAFALDGTGRIRIPEGIYTLDVELFCFLNAADTIADDYDGSADIEIPASVMRFDGNWSSLMVDELLHVEAGSEAERYAWKNEVDFNYNFDTSSEDYQTPVEAEAIHTIEKEGYTFDEDGTTLIKAPEDITEAVIPEGTLEIGERAFSYCKDLKTVRFPEGLIRIGDFAFNSCTSLEEISFPDSLEELGYDVFYGRDMAVKVKDGVVKLGPSFTKCSSSTFWGLVFDSFEVDEKNTTYSSVNGMLCNKQGTILYSVPTTSEGRVEIPDGIVVVPYNAVKTVDMGLLSGKRYEKITEIQVPDSVKYIDRQGIPYQYEEGYLVTLYVKKGSYGQKFAKEYNVPVKIQS